MKKKENDRPKDFSRIIKFSKKRSFPFFVFWIGGIIGILLDLDHFVCLLQGANWKPEDYEFGCRLFHTAYVNLSWIILIIVGTCLVGWFIYLGIHTIRTTTHTK